MHPSQFIVVTGATGRQGGAVARHLVAAGWHVKALVRNPSKPAARRLATLGIELVTGDLNDVSSLVRAFNGAHGVFAVTDFWKNGVEAERQHGKNLVEAAAATQVNHFVFTSGSGVHYAAGVPQLESKWETEQLAWRLGVPTTVLRPNFFMEMFTDRALVPPLMWGMLRKVIGPTKRIGWIAVDDVGAAAAVVFGDPERYLGHTITLAGDRRSMDECAALFTRIHDKRPFAVALPSWFMRRFVSAELMALLEWVARSPIEGSVAETYALCGARDMEQWLLGSQRPSTTRKADAAVQHTRAA